MRAFAIAGSVFFSLCLSAAADDAASLVGTWTRTGFSAAQIGEHPGYAPLTKPSLIHGNDPDWKMKIDAQEGGSFSGTLTGPNGRPQTILGTLQRDGKHFVFSTNDDMGSGMAATTSWNIAGRPRASASSGPVAPPISGTSEAGSQKEETPLGLGTGMRGLAWGRVWVTKATLNKYG
jgi:hypothetical protein